MKKITLSVIALTLVLVAFGQNFPFQGELIESDVPVNGIRISNISSGWSESHADVPIYNVLNYEGKFVENLKNRENSIKEYELNSDESNSSSATKVYLLDTQTGQIISETETDENGYFIFSNLSYQNFVFIVFILDKPLEPYQLTFEGNNSVKEVEIRGNVRTERISASVNVVSEKPCNPNNLEYSVWYLDNDGDGYGTKTFSVGQCTPPEGYVSNNLDCDDSDSDINLDMTDEAGSGIDANCDGYFLWYIDTDGDGFGSELTISSTNSFPGVGESYNPSDCDDSNSDINPDAIESVGSVIDANCDGTVTYLELSILDFYVPEKQVNTNETFDISVIFEGGNLVSAVWDWGDSTSTDAKVSTDSISGNHIYEKAGLYDIVLSIENESGDLAKKTFSYAVVINPCAGGIQGFSVIESPKNSVPANPNIYGSASLAFYIKYNSNSETNKLGSTLSFYFHKARFWFNAKSTDWLMVNNNLVIFKGRGEINDKGSYNYLVSMIDGDKTEKNAPDYFRLKVWDDDGVVLYDNQIGDSDSALPITQITSEALQIAKGCDEIKSIKNALIEDSKGFGPDFDISINAYPNPTTGKIFLQIDNFNDSGFTINVMNLIGQKVFEQLYQSQSHIELDLTNNDLGIYFVNFIQDEKRITKKIILGNR